MPDLLPDEHGRRHQPLPRRELCRARRAVRPARRRAISTVDAKTPGISGPGLVGWHLPDEADVSVGIAQKLPAAEGDGRVTFLTLTDHFSQRAAPPPNGKEIYPAFFDSADVIGFDTYPVEVRCTIEQIDNVYWMQRELVSLTGGKPTFQWIEAGPMEHCRDNEDPTPAVVRAETWLAIAGGARGIGYFPDWWAEDIRNEVRLVNREILALAPALLAPVAKANWSTESPVRVGARPLQRRDVRHRREHLDVADDHVVHHARASAAASFASSATAAPSPRSAISSSTSSPASASRSTSSRPPAGREAEPFAPLVRYVRSE